MTFGEFVMMITCFAIVAGIGMIGGILTNRFLGHWTVLVDTLAFVVIGLAIICYCTDTNILVAFEDIWEAEMVDLLPVFAEIAAYAVGSSMGQKFHIERR